MKGHKKPTWLERKIAVAQFRIAAALWRYKMSGGAKR